MPSQVRSQPLLVVALAALCFAALLQVAAAYGAALLPAAVVALLLLAAVLVPWARGAEPDPAARARDVSERAAWAILLIILLAALGLRLYTLLDRPAWADEMWTLRNTYSSDLAELLRVAFDDYWPPLYYLVLNLVARVADTSLISLRLPSVIFGVAAVALMYPLGLQLFGRRSLALVASALLAGMTAHIVFSQEARVYSLQLVLAILSAWFFYMSYWERRISPAFVLSTVLLTYAHSFSSWYFVAGQCVYVLVAYMIWKDRRAFVKGVLSQVLVVLIWMPLLAAFAWARFSRDIVVPTYWATGVRDLPGIVDIVEQYQGLAVRSWAGAAFMALLFGLAVWLAWQRRAARGRNVRPACSAGYAQAVVFLLCWAIVPVLFSLVVTVGTSMKTFGEIRYHLTVLPGLCLLATAGFAVLRSRYAFALAASLLVLLPAAELPRYYREFTNTREAHDQAAALIRSRAADSERIYVGNGYRVFNYYFRGFFPRIGSERWDSLAAAHAHLDDRATLFSPKWGDTYAYEKMSPRIANFNFYPLGYDGANGGPFIRFIRDELERGGFEGTYWLVLDELSEELVPPALEQMDIPCRSPEVYHYPNLEVRRCNPPEAVAPSDSVSAPVTRLQKSEENAGSRMLSSVSQAG